MTVSLTMIETGRDQPTESDLENFRLESKLMILTTAVEMVLSGELAPKEQRILERALKLKDQVR